MSLDYTKLKVGDKVRYLGGDIVNDDDSDTFRMDVGGVYEVVDLDMASPVLSVLDGCRWNVAGYNAHCFELVDEESSTSCNCDCKHESHIVSLATKVAELNKELGELRDVLQEQAHEEIERIERILDDIVMLDERTQDVSNSEPKPVRKVVYEYERN